MDIHELAHHDRILATGDFVRAARIKAVARAEGPGSLEAVAARMKATERARQLLKSATPAGTSGDGWAGDLQDSGATGRAFLAALRNRSAFDAMLPAMRSAPLRTRFVLESIGASGAETAEGEHKPISRLTLGNATLPVKKASSILVLTREVAESLEDGVQAMISAELQNAVAHETDASFVADLSAAAEDSPAITSSGATAAAIMADLLALAEAVTAHRGQRLFLLAAPANVRRLALKTDTTGRKAFPAVTIDGGEIAGIGVVPTDGVDPDEALLADASQIAANGGTIALGTAADTTLRLDPQSQTLISLWQTNSVAIRSERRFGYAILRDGTVAKLEAVDWS